MTTVNRPMLNRCLGFLLSTAFCVPVLAQKVTQPATERARDPNAVPVLRINVSPTGNDSGNGLTASPVRTLAAAQALARQAIAKMSAQGNRRPVEVLLAPGTYTLDATFQIGPEDSGTPDAPVVYRAEKPGTAHVSGGCRRAAPRGQRAS